MHRETVDGSREAAVRGKSASTRSGRARAVLAAAVLAIGPAHSVAQADPFVVRPGGGNRVVFVSKAPMESFEGRTRALSGAITVNPAAVGDSVTVWLEVDMASLDTGIGRRNQHMRDNHLETKKFPKAWFEGATVVGPPGAALESGRPVTLDVEGTFTLHGVSRRLRLAVACTRIRDGARDEIGFHTEFPVTLSDYGISRPQFLFLKLAETQRVRVEGVAIAVGSGAAR